MVQLFAAATATVLLLASGSGVGVAAENILRTGGFTECENDPSVKVKDVDINYNADSKKISFNIAGTSDKEQKVMARLTVTAFGNEIYENSFNPCDDDTLVEKLCPLPEGPFNATGTQDIPEKFASMVPGIAFQLPDIAAMARMELKSVDSDENVACIQSQVDNGKTTDLPSVSYVAMGVAGLALAGSGLAALGSAVSGAGVDGGGQGTLSPSFTETMGWLQGIAMNGMLTVNYPPVYRSFTKNFAFSVGLVSWKPLQERLDSFRASTGGNLTQDSVAYLEKATLVFPDGTMVTPSGGNKDDSAAKVKRAFDAFATLVARDDNSDNGGGADFQKTVSGLQNFASQLQIPDGDVFMTILMCAAIAIAAIIAGILLFKIILETWAIWGNFPANLAGFRKHYWGTMARTITTLIFIFYGIWVLWCIFQFTIGDSWAATTLAGVTLAIFTTVLVGFAVKIFLKVRQLKREHGDTSPLYTDKSTWTKYSLFYDSFRHGYWWIFTPVILYMLVKGCVLAGAKDSGQVQTIALIVIECAMLILLLWSRPYERRSGNVINIIIQVVRVLSIACILVFVEQFGFKQTTQTITGVALIVVQSTLTGILVILIIWNGFNACCQVNPHRKRRKDLEKARESNLTPLDARNTLLFAPGSDQPAAAGVANEKGGADYHVHKSANFSVHSVDTNSNHGRSYSGGPHNYSRLSTVQPYDPAVQPGAPQELQGRQPAYPAVASDPIVANNNTGYGVPPSYRPY